MALTVTLGNVAHGVMGNLRKTHATIDFDSSYLAGGESLTPAMFGLRVIDMILIEPKNGYAFEYDYTNSILSVLSAPTQGVIFTTTSITSNVGIGEDTLASTTLMANALSQDGMGIRVTGWGTSISTAAGAIRYIRGMFGSASTGAAVLTAGQAGSWKAVMEVVRTSATTQATSFALSGASTVGVALAGVGYRNHTAVTSSTLGSSDLSTSKSINFTGTTNTSIEDIRQQGMIVEVFNPNAGAGSAQMEIPSGTDLSSLTGVRAIVWGV